MHQLEEVHTSIFEVSKSLNTANKVVNDIIDSTDILSLQPEIYTLDDNKLNNEGIYRSYNIVGSNNVQSFENILELHFLYIFLYKIKNTLLC